MGKIRHIIDRHSLNTGIQNIRKLHQTFLTVILHVLPVHRVRKLNFIVSHENEGSLSIDIGDIRTNTIE
jgi:hypothetical protein